MTSITQGRFIFENTDYGGDVDVSIKPPRISRCANCPNTTENTICDDCRCGGCGRLDILCECEKSGEKTTKPPYKTKKEGTEVDTGKAKAD